MEFSRTNENELIIENEFFDIFPIQFFCGKGTFDINYARKYKFADIFQCDWKWNWIFKNCMAKEKNEEFIIGMHCFGHIIL